MKKIIDTIDRIGWGADYFLRTGFKKWFKDITVAYRYQPNHLLTRANRFSAVIAQPARG